jgi:hypothetical protein
MNNTWKRTDPEDGADQKLVLVEAEPGVIQMTTEVVEELLEQAGWEQA